MPTNRIILPIGELGMSGIWCIYVANLHYWYYVYVCAGYHVLCYYAQLLRVPLMSQAKECMIDIPEYI